MEDEEHDSDDEGRSHEKDVEKGEEVKTSESVANDKISSSDQKNLQRLSE